MIYALIKNGAVRNVINADPDFIPLIAADWDHIESLEVGGVQLPNIGIGWLWVDGVFVDPTPPVVEEP